jgi:uncharacterized membrane protein YphA (DoxX/SURF4 family)
VGVTAVTEGALYLQGFSSLSAGAAGQLVLSLLLVLGGVALLVGCLTPVAGFVSGLCFAAMFLGFLPNHTEGLVGSRAAIVRVMLISVSIILLGPGGFSVDAFLFGRREIVIPPAERPPQE